MITNTVTAIQQLSTGINVAYPFPNKIFAASDLAITAIDLAGTAHPFTFLSGSTFTGPVTASVTNIDVDTGCTVTLSAPLAVNWILDIRTNTAELQQTSIKNQGQFLPDLHEEAFDRLTREIQDLKRLTYTFGVHGTDADIVPWSPLPGAVVRANKTLGFDGTGQPIVFTEGEPGPGPAGLAVTDGTTVVPLVETLAFTGATVAHSGANQAMVKVVTYPQTSAEVVAGVVPINPQYAPINVLRYGAKGDGVTDDQIAFNHAVAVASVGGGAVYVPGGCTYKCSMNINITASNVMVYGDGPSSIITFSDTTNRLSGITFTGTAGVRIANAQVNNLVLVGAGTYGSGFSTGNGIYTNFTDGVRIHDVTAHEWSDNAFAIGGGIVGGGNGISVTNCLGYNVGQGVSIFSGSSNILVDGNIFHDIKLYVGIDIEGTTVGGNDNYCIVSNNLVYTLPGPTSQADGIALVNAWYTTVTGNVCYGVLGGGTNGNGSGINLVGSSFCNLSQNICFSNSGYGIAVGANSNSCAVTGNTTYNNVMGSCIVSDFGVHSTLLALIDGNNFTDGEAVLGVNATLRTPFNANKGTFDTTAFAVGTTAAGTATYSIKLARYSLIDNLVNFYISLSWTGHTGTGGIQINGLPRASFGLMTYPVNVFINGLPITAGNVIFARVAQGGTTIQLYQWTPSTGMLTEIPLPTACAGLNISGFYAIS